MSPPKHAFAHLNALRRGGRHVRALHREREALAGHRLRRRRLQPEDDQVDAAGDLRTHAFVGGFEP